MRYTILKNRLEESQESWQVTLYLTDYEQGAYLAMNEVFSGIGKEGCYFHLSKSLDTKVMRLSLFNHAVDDLEKKSISINLCVADCC